MFLFCFSFFGGLPCLVMVVVAVVLVDGGGGGGWLMMEVVVVVDGGVVWWLLLLLCGGGCGGGGGGMRGFVPFRFCWHGDDEGRQSLTASSVPPLGLSHPVRDDGNSPAGVAAYRGDSSVYGLQRRLDL